MLLLPFGNELLLLRIAVGLDCCCCELLLACTARQNSRCGQAPNGLDPVEHHISLFHWISLFH
jgi:hypothetical protein